VVAYISI